MNIEARLAELIGPAAGRLHTARSRNDQVATDFRLWVRGATTLDKALRELQKRADRAGRGACRHRNAGLYPPADRTAGHVRPSLAGLCRDARARPRPLRRLPPPAQTNSRSAPPRSPGPRSRSTARMTANALGFDRPDGNSLDAVSDRDFAIEFLAAAALAGTHLSRLAEEIVIWASDAVRVYPAQRRVHDRQLNHAAKAQSRRRRAGARQDRPARWRACWRC